MLRRFSKRLHQFNQFISDLILGEDSTPDMLSQRRLESSFDGDDHIRGLV